MDIVTEEVIGERLRAEAVEEPRAAVAGNFATPRRLVELAVTTWPAVCCFVLNP